MDSVFVSYRRGDSEGQARALVESLRSRLGKNSVFMDVDNIALGRDFRAVLNERLARTTCMLVVIGPGWLSVLDEAGLRRLDAPNDYVRQEVAVALQRNIAVVPVLLKGASHPVEEQLPGDIKGLAFRQSFDLRHDRWDSDVTELVRRLEPPRVADSRRPWAIAVAAVAVLSLVVAIYLATWTTHDTAADLRSAGTDTTTPIAQDVRPRDSTSTSSGPKAVSTTGATMETPKVAESVAQPREVLKREASPDAPTPPSGGAFTSKTETPASVIDKLVYVQRLATALDNYSRLQNSAWATSVEGCVVSHGPSQGLTAFDLTKDRPARFWRDAQSGGYVVEWMLPNGRPVSVGSADAEPIRAIFDAYQAAARVCQSSSARANP